MATLKSGMFIKKAIIKQRKHFTSLDQNVIILVKTLIYLPLERARIVFIFLDIEKYKKLD